MEDSNSKIYKFLTGTCTKHELFDNIIQLYVNSGWKKIILDEETGDTILYSKGVDGNRNLAFQIRPQNVAGALNSDVRHSTLNIMSLRLISGFTIEKVGEEDILTIDRPSVAWRPLNLAPVAANDQIQGNTEITFRYNVDANRMIMFIEYPTGLLIEPTMFYLGLSNEAMIEEPDSKGLIFASSSGMPTANNIFITDNPNGVGAGDVDVARVNYCTLAPRNPNTDRRYNISEIFYGSVSDGFRGKYDGIWLMPNENAFTGLEFMKNSRRFRCTVVGARNRNSFNSRTFVYEI